MNSLTCARIPGRLLFACALAAPLVVTSARGQPAHDDASAAAVDLTPVVITAARTPQAADTVASSVTVITPGELHDRQISSIGDALRSVPGVGIIQTGGSGGVTYLSVRGSKSGQTLLRVDGVRFNDSNMTTQSWLGGFSPAGNDRMEVLRGPQSTLYGGAAMGGVVSIDLQRGSGAPSELIALETGSFGTVRGTLSAQGEVNTFAYTLTASGMDTNNDRPNNDAHLQNYALRLDYQAADHVAVGGTVRHLESHYQDPNDIRTTNTTPINNNDVRNTLATAFIEFTPSERWSSRLTAGYQSEIYHNDGSFSGTPSPYSREIRREILEWQNNIRILDTLTAVVGASHERSAFWDSGTYPDDHLKGVYGQAEWEPVTGLRLGAGVRYDDYDSFGDTATHRFTVSRRVAATGSRLHATYGTSFLPPSVSQRYGSAFTAAAPGLKAEESDGWDVGVEQTLIADKLTMDVTFFRNDYKNLIAFQSAPFPAPGTYANIGRARTQGVETSIKAVLSPRLSVTAAYTYLDAKDEISGARLHDRPRHTFSANLDWKPTEAWLLGAGVHGTADRLVQNFNTFPSSDVKPSSYTVFRVYSRYQVTPRLAIHARVENLFDADYEGTYGFPSLGTEAFAGAEWRF